MTNVLLCGGSGTRLWPLSRTLFPKQFVPLFEGRSLFEETVNRNAPFCDSFTVVTNEELQFMALAQFENVAENRNVQSILEPVGRNTAPAIALAAFAAKSSDEILFVTPTDHKIGSLDAYLRAVNAGTEAAMRGKLVTFGIVPRYPETGYGYIECDMTKELIDDVFGVSSFKEKPDKNLAASYISKGNYYWNSGIFMFKAGIFLEELSVYRPDIFQASKTAFETHCRFSIGKCRGLTISHDAMMSIPSESIDYAVMEKSSTVATVVSEFEWNDLGSFDALYELLPKDENNSTVDSNLMSFESTDNLVISSKRKIVLLNVHDSIVIDTADALLVASRGSSQQVKTVVDTLKKGDANDFALTSLHTTVFRPWGYFTVLESHDGFKIKKTVVKPHTRLSLQTHMHRSEHWVVVRGRADVTIGEKISTVQPNESVFIPVGVAHRLGNSANEELVIIETQVGDYIGEDDIVRIEDDYLR